MWRTFVICFFGLCYVCCALASDFGARYLGTRYVASPLGESVLPDDDPLIRFDAFDCVTFVETVLADGNVAQLNKIRYANGMPSFTNRNHFIETDWLRNNAHLVRDVTAQYGKVKSRAVTIDKKNWFKKNYNIDTKFAPETVQLKYIPYENISDIRPHAPVIVLFITDSDNIRNKIGTDLAVRHTGILLPTGVLRHASQTAGRVVDVIFTKYVKQMMENKNNLGIMVLEIKK